MPIPAGEDTLSWKPDYITVEEFKSYKRSTVDEDDSEIADAITAASRAIDRHCHRQFGRVAVAETRYYTAEYDSRTGIWYVPIDDLMTTTDLVVQVESESLTLTSDEYKLTPRNALMKGMPWTTLTALRSAGVDLTTDADDIALTAIWGWSAVPATVKFACKLQTNRFLSRRESPYGVAGSPAVGSELRLLSKVDPDVGVMLREYVRMVGPL